MLPGFTGASLEPPAEFAQQAVLAEQGVAVAGFWDWLTGGDNSQGERCNFDHTETKCILFTMWCNNIFACGIDYGSHTPKTKDSGWYICGVCGNPFDW
ncbi:MAG: hypothetical protein ABI680_04075 [Chthoniobacteraceae bacterium]